MELDIRAHDMELPLPICHAFPRATTSMEYTIPSATCTLIGGTFKLQPKHPHYLARISVAAKHRPALQGHKRTQSSPYVNWGLVIFMGIEAEV